MRPDDDLDDLGKVLVGHLDEFQPIYDDLLDSYGEDCTAQVVFNALAEDVDEMLLDSEENEAILQRYFQALEQLATEIGQDADEEIAYAFYDALSPDGKRLSKAFMGPTTLQVIAEMAPDYSD